MLNQDDFKKRVGDKWWKYLQPFFASKEAFDIYQELKKQVKGGNVITPKADDVWKFLKNIDPEGVKVIFIALDSYPSMYNKNLFHATGIPLDCSYAPDGKLQPSLIEFWNGISAEYEQEITKTNDLQFLLDQGVLLANRGLTCRMYQTGSHLELWDPFWKHFFELYVSQRPDIPVVFLGKEAEKLKKYVTFNRTFFLSHPSASARTGQTWKTENVFHKINEIVQSLNGKDYKIYWDVKEYNQWLNEIPF